MRLFAYIYCGLLVAMALCLVGARVASAQELDAGGAEVGGADDLPQRAESSSSKASTDVAAPLSDQQAPTARDALPATSGGVGVAGPDVYWLIDENGKPRQFINYRYEDFLRAMQSAVAGEASESPPKHHIRSVALQAEEKSDALECRIEIEVMLADAGWIVVPLEFGSLIGQSAAVQGGEAQQYVEYDAATKSYVAYLKGEEGEARRVELRGLMTPKAEEGRRVLAIDGPVAPTTADILVSLATVDATVEPAGQVSTDSIGASTSRIRLVSRGDAARLSWAPDNAASDPPAGWEVDGAVLAALEGGALRYDATLELRRVTTPVDRVRVQLPPEATLVSAESSADYEVEVVPQSRSAEADSNRQLIEVRFGSDEVEAATIRLVAEARVDELSEPTETAIGSFDVLGAIRQRGAVALQVGANLHYYCDLVGRIDEADVETAGPPSADEADAAFVYASADYAIGVHTQQRVRNVRVRPRHALQLFADHAELTTELDYQITGGRTHDLRVDLNGWMQTDDPIESDGAIDLAGLHVTRDGLLILPLVDPDAQQVSVRFSLRRPIQLGRNSLKFPTARGGHSLPGALELVSDRDVRIQTDFESSTGVGSFGVDLTDNPSTATRVAGDDQVDSFSLQTYLADPVLAILVAERERPMRVESVISVELRSSTAAVEQQFEFDAAGRNMSTVAVALTGEIAEIWQTGGLRVLLDGKLVGAGKVSVSPAGGEGTQATPTDGTLTIRPARPLDDRVELALDYVLPRDGEASDSDGNRRIAIPVARLLEGDQSTSAVVMQSGNFQVGIDQSGGRPGSWRIADAGSDGRDYRFVEQVASSTLPLALTPIGPRESIVAVDRAWAQTWFSGNVRQERFVFRIRMEGVALQVEAPEKWDLAKTEALVDGEPADLLTATDGRWELRFAAVREPHWHTLEFRRQTTAPLGLWAKIELDWPTIASRGVTQRVYWHVVTPRNFVSSFASSGLFGEYRVGWNGAQWGRQPVMSQDQLERWTQAATAPAPPASANQYLYSSLGIPAKCEAHLARGSWIALLACSVCFALVMAAIRFRAGRHVAFWCLLALAVGAVAMLRPELAIVLLQATLGGGLLALATLLLRRTILGFAPASTFAAPAGSTAAFDVVRDIVDLREAHVGRSSTGAAQESVTAGDSRS